LGSESRPLGLDAGRASALAANTSTALRQRTVDFQPLGQWCHALNSWCKLTPGKELRPGLQIGSFPKRTEGYLFRAEAEGYLVQACTDYEEAKERAQEMKEFTGKKIRHSVAFCQFGTTSWSALFGFVGEKVNVLVLQEGKLPGDAKLSEGLENVALLKDTLDADAKKEDGEKKVKPEAKKKIAKALCEFGTDMKQHKMVLHDLGASVLTEIKKPKTIVVAVLPGEFETLKDEEGEEQKDAVKDVEAFLKEWDLGESCEQT